MKTINNLYLILLLIILTSCSQDEFNITNPNHPDAKSTLALASDLQNFNITNHTAVFQAQIGFTGIYFRGLADQFTTTNAFSSFWSYCDQPRRQIVNSTSDDDLTWTAGGPWREFNAVINNSNIIIENIEVEGNSITIDNVDLTEVELAGAYFDKGLAQGYLALIYDKAYIVDPDTDIEALEFSHYSEVMQTAISNLEKAISLATGLSNFSYNIYPGATSLSNSGFVQLANSYLARLSIGVARTDAEAQLLDYNKILTYANNGITSDFYPDSKEDILFNNLQDWALFQLGDGSGYMPTDIKIAHLFDPDYPTEYPLGVSDVLPAATTSDPRLELYYEYVGDNFGFLRAARGRHLFSSYRHTRFFNANNENTDGLPTQLFPKAELDYIKAEAYLRLGNIPLAVSALDASPRFTVGGQSTSSTAEAVRNVLIYENSIELDLNSGIATTFNFMRRHDLLQPGTPTMYPVPASELEISQDEIYTFGSPSNSGETGTASGSNDWRNIDLIY